MGYDVSHWHNVSVFGVDVEQRGKMWQICSVAYGFLGDYGSKAVGARINGGRADTPTRRASHEDHRVDRPSDESSEQIGPEKA